MYACLVDFEIAIAQLRSRYGALVAHLFPAGLRCIQKPISLRGVSGQVHYSDGDLPTVVMEALGKGVGGRQAGTGVTNKNADSSS